MNPLEKDLEVAIEKVLEKYPGDSLAIYSACQAVIYNIYTRLQEKADTTKVEKWLKEKCNASK